MAKPTKDTTPAIMVAFCTRSHFGTQNPVIDQVEMGSLQEANERSVTWCRANVENNTVISVGRDSFGTWAHEGTNLKFTPAN